MCAEVPMAGAADAAVDPSNAKIVAYEYITPHELPRKVLGGGEGRNA